MQRETQEAQQHQLKKPDNHTSAAYTFKFVSLLSPLFSLSSSAPAKQLEAQLDALRRACRSGG
eukprot:3741095-Rhodomonas_salina.1